MAKYTKPAIVASSGIAGVLLITAIFMLAQSGQLVINSYDWSKVCAGKTGDLCWAEINFTMKNTTCFEGSPDWRYIFNTDKSVKNLKVYRNGRIMNTSNNFCFNKGQTIVLKFTAEKLSPYDTIKWGFAELDPYWEGVAKIELLSESNTMTSGDAILNITPNDQNFVIDEKEITGWVEKSTGASDVKRMTIKTGQMEKFVDITPMQRRECANSTTFNETNQSYEYPQTCKIIKYNETNSGSRINWQPKASATRTVDSSVYLWVHADWKFNQGFYYDWKLNISNYITPFKAWQGAIFQECYNLTLHDNATAQPVANAWLEFRNIKTNGAYSVTNFTKETWFGNDTTTFQKVTWNGTSNVFNLSGNLSYLEGDVVTICFGNASYAGTDNDALLPTLNRTKATDVWDFEEYAVGALPDGWFQYPGTQLGKWTVIAETYSGKALKVTTNPGATAYAGRNFTTSNTIKGEISVTARFNQTSTTNEFWGFTSNHGNVFYDVFLKTETTTMLVKSNDAGAGAYVSTGYSVPLNTWLKMAMYFSNLTSVQFLFNDSATPVKFIGVGDPTNYKHFFVGADPGGVSIWDDIKIFMAHVYGNETNVSYTVTTNWTHEPAVNNAPQIINALSTQFFYSDNGAMANTSFNYTDAEGDKGNVTAYCENNSGAQTISSKTFLNVANNTFLSYNCTAGDPAILENWTIEANATDAQGLAGAPNMTSQIVIGRMIGRVLDGTNSNAKIPGAWVFVTNQSDNKTIASFNANSTGGWVINITQAGNYTATARFNITLPGASNPFVSVT